MPSIKAILNARYTFWLLLALPSLGLLAGYFGGGGAQPLLHPTGEFAARFMIVAMMITPLRMLFPKQSWTGWLLLRRRHLGVAAFGYALLHLAFYLIDMGSFGAVWAEAFELGIWTGWLAFLIFVPLAVTSNNAAMRLLRKKWKPLQRWVYPAAVLTLLHWMFIHNDFGAALVQFAPLAALEIYRVVKLLQNRRPAPTAA